MQVLTKIDKDEKNKWEDPCINIRYAKKYYQKIENVQSFGMESFVSGVGGFIGIFLGYSLLQLPEFFTYVVSFLDKLKMWGPKERKTKIAFRRNNKVV